MSIKNLLGWGTRVSLALASLVSLSNSANAAFLPLSAGGQLNFITYAQFNSSQAGFTVPSLFDFDTRYGIEGLSDQFGDFLFAPSIPDISVGPPVNNRIIDNVDPQCTSLTLGGTQGCTQDADPGERGILRVSSGNTGSFSNLAPLTGGTIRSFDNSSSAFGTYLPNTFQYPFVNITDGQSVFDFTLDSFNSSIIVGPDGPRFYFTGLGRVRQIDVASGSLLSEANYHFTIPSMFNDSGMGGDPVAGDGISAPSRVSFSFIVTSSVPEPNGIIGTAIAVGLGLLTYKKKRV